MLRCGELNDRKMGYKAISNTCINVHVFCVLHFTD